MENKLEITPIGSRERNGGEMVDFYQTHLDRVSRSFAICIARLEEPLRKWVSLTYLACRILDTVEDAPWPKKGSQMNSFEIFDSFLDLPPQVLKVQRWASDIPDSIPLGERLLLKDAHRILTELHQGPGEFKLPIQRLVQNMSAGMKYFANLRTHEGLVLRSIAEVNQYCFFVAGIVGETLAKLLGVKNRDVKLTKEVLVNAHHFGLFLQKVNLLKDQLVDESEGRFLIPSREKIYESLAANANGAVKYIETIPLEEKSYRVFCLWSLFLGLKTLPLLNSKKIESTNLLKIPRSETQGLFNIIEAYACVPEKIRMGFEMLMAEAKLSVGQKLFEPAKENVHGESTWFSKVYKGDLSGSDFEQLKMI